MPQVIHGTPCRKEGHIERYVAKNGKTGSCRPCVLAQSKEKKQELNLRHFYGLSMETYRRMHQEQNGLCAICQKPETAIYRDGSTKALAVDHDHTTGKVRGLLCLHCNQGLGRFQDNPALLQIAAAYLLVDRSR